MTRQEGEDCARRLKALFIECSAKTKAGVEQAFEELVQKVRTHQVTGAPGPDRPDHRSDPCGLVAESPQMIDTPSLWQKLPKKAAGVELAASTDDNGEPSGCYC